jgi:hypothetical protein
MSNGILDFLVSGLEGPQRDAVTRAFYEYAQGDPHSSPVGMAEGGHAAGNPSREHQ